MASIDGAIAPAPITHYPRGHANSDAAVPAKSSADASHSIPRAGEMGCVKWGSSAQPKAFEAPRR